MEHLPNYERQDRPWGNFERYTLNDAATVHALTVRAGEKLQVESHDERDAFWKVVSGSGVVTMGQEEKSAAPGEQFWIPRGTAYGLTANAGEDLQVLEVAFGSFDENDIHRYDDR